METMDHENPNYLTPTEIIDSNHPKIQEYATQTIGDCSDPVERAVLLYLAEGLARHHGADSKP